MIEALIFYMFAGLVVASGIMVIWARNPVHSVLWLILAFLSSGRGIVVHRETCANVEDYRKHPENWISVVWENTPGRMFSSELRVEVENRMGVLAAVAAAIAGTETNIDHVELQERDPQTSILVFELRVRDRKHLAGIVRVIRRMPEVLKVFRTLATRSRQD